MVKQLTKKQTAARETDRIIALDIIRGYFIILIASIHLAYYPSISGLLSGRGRMWVSEADGFFFVSGLLIGIIRNRDIIKSGLRTAQKKVLARATKLYITSVILSIIFVIIGRVATAHQVSGSKYGLDTTSTMPHLIWQIITFQYGYGWTDFLMYYALFLFIAPLVLWLLTKKLWWVALSGIAIAWIIGWSGKTSPAVQGFLQWQAPFFMGTLIGYHWHAILAWFHSFPIKAQRQIGHGLIAGAVIIFILGYIFVIIPEFFQAQGAPAGIMHGFVSFTLDVYHNALYNNMLLKARTGLLRPLLLLVVIGGIFTFVRRYESTIIKWFGWLLIPFGVNSLYAYILEGIIIFSIPFMIDKSSRWIINTFIELSVVAIVWLAIKKRWLFKIIPR